MSMPSKARDAVQDHSRNALKRGSRSFDTAALLFDAKTRDSARLLYAWCRYCDDVVDGQVLGTRVDSRVTAVGTPRQRLAVLRRATIAAHGGHPPGHPVFEAFQRVSQRHDLPLQLPLALLDGFGMDVEHRHYRTFGDTLDYCYHVAGVVGLMMARMMGVSDERVLDRACDLGIAFQLTNIARDVVEDWENGRVYLPQQWLDQARLPAHRLGDPAEAERLATIVAELLRVADDYYRSATVGIDALPFRAGWAVDAAQRIYRAIGVKIQDRGAKAWRGRVVVPHTEKLGHGAAALAAMIRRYGRGTLQVTPRPSTLWSRPR